MTYRPPIYVPSKDIAWNFLQQKKPSRLTRAKSGRAVQAKAALKKIEEAIRDRQAARAKRAV